jgi:TRAP-type C4-dicarboxylate transport system permease small subunit
MSHGFELNPVKGPEMAASGILAKVSRLVARFNDWVMTVCTFAIMAAACILTYSVVSRYLLKISTDWQDEASVFLLVGAIFMCGAYVQSYRGHIGIEALASILPASVNKIRKILIDIASLAFCSFFSWKSWILFYEALVEGYTTSSSVAPPLWIPYGVMAAGMTMLALQILLQVLAHFMGKKVAA